MVLAAVAAITVALSGCAGSERDSGGGDNNANGASSKDTLVFGAAGEPKLFDPAFASDGESFRPARQIFDGLYKFYRDHPSDNDPLLAETVGAQLIVRVTARAIFPNCPRYIPTMSAIEPSIYVPLAGQDAPEPAWKGFADFKECIHPRQPTFKG